MSKGKFIGSAHASTYITNKKLSTDVKYQLRNGAVIIDLKSLVDDILDEEEIGKYKTSKLTLNIPFDMEKVVTGNSINIVVDKNRYTLRLKSLEVLPSKQQKIDFDNTHPHRWSMNQWVKLLEDLFWQSYGFKAPELDLRGPTGGVRRGKAFGAIKRIKTKVTGAAGFNFKEYDVVEYLRWAFTKKSDKITLNLGLLQSDSLVQEWLASKKKSAQTSKPNGKARTWRKL
jgi:hypothetical protein